MLKTTAAGLFLFASASLAMAQETASSLDVSKLYGDWEYVEGTRAGEEVDAERLAGTVTITAETWTLPGGPDATFVMAYKLDLDKDPVTIDFNIKEGPVPEGEAKGIVALDGDTLTLCYHPMGGERPAKLESTADNGAFLFVLKRKS